jgi:heme-degrading monooxygenase HmoA
MSKLYWISLVAASLGPLACSSNEDDGEPARAAEARGTPEASLGDTSSEDSRSSDAPLGATPPQPALAGCVRGTLEPDFVAAPLAGPAVIGGALRPGQYVFSTTYLQLAREPAAQSLFQELLAPVLTDLETRAGLAAVMLGQSESCSAARTLAVWEDDAAMIAFVASPAHSAAMVRVTDISRGGSTVTHWTGDEASASWTTAAQRIGAADGPQY